MRREFITEEELMGLIHQQGIENLDEVNEGFMEGGGRVSAIANERKTQGTPDRKKR